MDNTWLCKWRHVDLTCWLSAHYPNQNFCDIQTVLLCDIVNHVITKPLLYSWTSGSAMMGIRDPTVHRFDYHHQCRFIRKNSEISKAGISLRLGACRNVSDKEGYQSPRHERTLSVMFSASSSVYYSHTTPVHRRAHTRTLITALRCFLD